ncbi:Aconitase/3-isopropylmalate dehydratase protein [Tripterygium wilfordii]|uniref:3-isopropylmalate dehydratase n=1 Tax=Tripterygium wilfordii TaxID=458696 RepID=A0A7J7CLH4_TRIWF|nr:3-isopropylmalate dehydratase small subunit 1-like [Tripterygium wilfordii]XP_038725300.1 3-isopropylmalate dehydratase small subunit 1-like [Tripterygium wilfordii]KAF5734910.1 Aconitase/3-isopropylmalate dehydratase protein [Tripterygium wilfordii]
MAAASLSLTMNPTVATTPKPKLVTFLSHSIKLISTSGTPSRFPSLISQQPSLSTGLASALTTCAAAASPFSSTTTDTTFHGLCYVVGDNIDTDQIIPAEYLTLVPSKPDEYDKLGSYALIGLPSSYEKRFVEPNETKTKYSIVIGGDNFGCGSSREHAPVALGAAGAKAVVAQSYARIFFRNSVSTGEIYPLESEVRICEECRTGDVVTIELAESRLINHTTGKQYKLKPIGDAGPVIEAGGIFAYARQTGMITAELAA